MSARQESSDEEHFSDASEGKDGSASPVPTTRVERVDNEQSHGEVPGTEAFEMRKQDAAPDEYEVIPEPVDVEIPQTVVEKVDEPQPSHGEVPGTEAHEMRKADAAPDVVKSAPSTGLEESPTSPRYRSSFRRRKSSRLSQGGQGPTPDDVKDDDDAGDDFDEFEEGDGELDDDFGAFDEGFNEEHEEDRLAAPSPLPPQQSLSLLDFRNLDTPAEIHSAAQEQVNALFAEFPTKPYTQTDTLPDASASFLTERSQSLWAQLVAPPPLQPPNWVRSRIRRGFLVSLGVPVDLDEILPASKQKKLVLPSLELDSTEHLVSSSNNRDSTSSNTARPTSDSMSKLKNPGPNDSSASVNSATSKPATTPGATERSKRRGPPPAPEFDLIGTRLLCSTTDAALHNLPLEELQSHVKKLLNLKGKASEVLEYWLVQRDSARGDKEAFEEVIENLVKHAKKIRK